MLSKLVLCSVAVIDIAAFIVITQLSTKIDDAASYAVIYMLHILAVVVLLHGGISGLDSEPKRKTTQLDKQECENEQ